MNKFARALQACLLFPCLFANTATAEKSQDYLKNVANQNSAPISTKQHYLISALTTPKTYYVNASKGNDSNNGLSSSSPFKTIQAAANLTNPGDTVLIMNGVYINSDPNGQVFYITRSGSPNAWITYKAAPGNNPVLKSNGWNGIRLYNNTAYIEINGLEVEGNNPNTSLAYAQSQATNSSNPLTNGNGIMIDGRYDGHPHHIRIINNKVHDFGGAGIPIVQADYVTIIGNQVYNNAWYSVYGNSGISTYQNWNSDSNTGYKMFIENNVVYNNREYIPWISAGQITDGNGIIVDDLRNTQNGSTLGAYNGRTLVANNLVYKNGGGGIHIYLSDHVDVVNNTSHYNNQSPEINRGQISANTASDVNVMNNILDAIPGKYINNTWNVNNVIFDYNLYYNGTPANITIEGNHDLFGDPKLMNSSAPDFRLQSTSPAIDKGYAWTALTSDFAGNPRSSGKGYDIGAYEYQVP